MSRRRFYSPASSFAADGKSLTLAGEEARHLREVLRLKRGDEVHVFTGDGREFRCLIEDSRRDVAHLNVVSEVEPARPESALQLTLAVALLKGEKFDLVVQKATELGVTRLLPVITRRADIRLRDESDANKRFSRWQRIAVEAAKQSGRAFVPEVATPVSFTEFVQSPSVPDQLKLMFSERDGEALPRLQRSHSSITALIGSEGGWTDEEISLARENDWKIVTLGGRTLRAETAAIAVAALLQHRCGDLT